MSRIPKWKFDKAKVKVVFRLQFHATNIPQSGWDKLFVSFIPADIGKATAKTNKANVRNGSCKWADPIYETTRLLQDTNTKKYDEKLYKLVVAMGTSRSSLLGDVYINLADYADASKPTSIALPLDGCESGTILHVTIQLLTSKTGFREFEQQREIREKGFPLASNQSQESVRKIRNSAAMDQIEKVNARVRFKPESTEEEDAGGLNEYLEDSAAGVDGSSCTSDSICAEKIDISSTHETDTTKITVPSDVGLPLDPSNQPENREKAECHLLAQGSNEWAHGWSSDYSVDNDLSSVYDENIRIKGCLVTTESSLLEMKTEISSLHSLAEELGAETQRLTHQFSSELASGEMLARELSILKSECSKLKDEFEALTHQKRMMNLTGRKTEDLFNPVIFGELSENNYQSVKEWVKKCCFLSSHDQAWPAVRKCDPSGSSFDSKFGNSDDSGDQKFFFVECHSQWLEGLKLLEDKVKEIRNRTQIINHENDVDYVADFGCLEYILLNLKQCIIPSSSDPVDGSNVNTIQATGMKQLVPVQPLVDQEQDNKNMMKEKICNLLTELEESRSEQEVLTKKMNQMGHYYESVIHELEERNKATLDELENVRAEHCSCMSTISAFQSQIENMHHEMNQQFLKLAEDKWYLESLNKELEKRAVSSETALKRVRWTYSMAVDRLQKDLELLSVQVLSMFETNENLAKQAFAEASKLYIDDHPQDLPQLMQSCLKNDLQRSFQHIQHKSSDLEHHEEPMAVKNEKGASPMFNGAGLDYRLSQSFALKSDNKGSFLSVPIYAEMQATKDVDAAHLNGWKTEKALSVVTPQTSIHGIRNLISADKLKVDEFSGYLPMLKPTDDPDKSKFVVPFPSENTKAKPEERGSFHLHKNLNLDMEIELYEVHMLNVHLDVFSKVLLETLIEKKNLVGSIKEQTDELSWQLECSTKSEELLMLKLKAALDDVRILKEDVVNFSAKCDHLTMEKYIMEAKLQDVSEENSSFAERLAEFERLTMDLKDYERKYNECNAEKLVFKNLLEEESLQKCCLQSELKSMTEDYNVVKVELDKRSSARDKLESTIDLLGEKLRCLCSNAESYDKQVDLLGSPSIPTEQKLENKDYLTVISHLEQVQLGAYKKILELSQKKKEVEEEKDALQAIVKDLESQLSVKHQSNSEVADVMTKLDLSNSLVEKLKSELQVVETKLEVKTESEEKLAEKSRELASKLTVMEYKLQDAASEKKDFSQRLLEFDRINVELDRARADIVKHRGGKEILMVSLQSANEEIFQLESEISKLKELLKCSNVELQTERGTREKLEETVTNLTLQLHEKNEQIISSDEQKAELAHLKLQLSNFESEKSGLHNLLLHHEECQRNLDDEISSLHNQIADLVSKLNCLKEALRSKHDELHAEKCFREEVEGKVTDISLQLNEKCEQLLYFNEQKSELAHLRQRVLDLQSQKSAVEQLLLNSKECQKDLESQVSLLHSQVSNLDSELNKTRESLGYTCNELHSERETREKLEATLSNFTTLLDEKKEQLLHFGEQKVELAHLRQHVSNLESEKSVTENLLSSSKETIKELDIQISVLHSQVTNLEAKLRNSSDILRLTQNELDSEREVRVPLETTISDLTSMLNEKQEQLVSFAEKTAELALLRQQVSDLKSEKTKLHSKISSENSFLHAKVTDLETRISVLHSQVTNLQAELSNSHDILRFTQNELDSEREIRVHLEATVSDLTSVLNERQEQLVSFDEKTAELVLLRQQVSDLKLEKFELHSKISGENSFLHAKVTELKTQLEELHDLLLTADVEVIFIMNQYQINLEGLFRKFKILEESHEELHRNHLDAVATLENCLTSKEYYLKENERLSETLQLLKSDLEHSDSRKEDPVGSIHERTMMSDKIKNHSVDTLVGGNDFQKHQSKIEIEQLKLLLSFEEEMDNLRSSRYEHELMGIILTSKLYEQQEHISLLQQCHGELTNLQDQHNDLMHRLSEQILKTEEFKNLSIHLKELKDNADAECHQIRGKRESGGPSIAMQESLRVAFIKEQYETKLQELQSQLLISKKHGEEILLKLQNALDEVEIRKKSEASLAKRNEELSIKVLELEAELQTVVNDRRELLKVYDKIKAELECSIISLDCCREEKVKLESSLRECNEDRKKARVELDLTKRRLESLSSTPDNQGSHEPGVPKPTSFGQLLEEHNFGSVQQQSCEDGLESKGTSETGRQGSMEMENLVQENTRYITDAKEQGREQHKLKSSIERLYQELERMKNENLDSLLPIDEQCSDPSLQKLEKELLQLDMANEHLGAIFPSFKELPGSGNALERVLALELELAEALKVKKKSDVFQSSFLRQHGDEESAFQSFRDINELIKDMLDLKGKYATVETELKEMQSRYSQLSLQFAEVEGERQKLIMTLKNVRTPKKIQS